ncbi:hypothetical protein ACQP10_27385 [Streptosporangium sandarakinum]|uniref:hypothetical protein n=1 Tax=Streptosporangium sandarakinum TaxID=1260955 RepID=UPI003D8A9987
MRPTHPVWAVLITVVAMLTQVIIGTAPVVLLLDRDNVLYRPLGMIGITLASLGLVCLIRRLGREPWRGMGLTRSWRAPLHLLLGVVQATALGFACAAARARTGALWAAVGVHTGSHLANMLLPTRDIAYDVQLVIVTGAFCVTGLLILSGRRRDGTAATDGTARTTAPSLFRR